MALFNFNKKKETKQLPSFRPMEDPIEAPKFPDMDLDDADFPSYKPTISEDSVANIPIRKPRMLMNDSPEDLDRKMPVFVKLTKYKSVKTSLNEVKSLVMEAEKAISKLEEIKREEDEELSIWHRNLDEIKEKLVMVDEKLFEA